MAVSTPYGPWVMELIRDICLHVMAGLCADKHPCELTHVTYEDACYRATRISHIRYRLILYLMPGESFCGLTEVHFHSAGEDQLWLDFNSTAITGYRLNGQSQSVDWRNGKIHLSPLVGQNHVSVEYEGKYRKNGAGLYSVFDPADGSQYIFSQFQADFAHTVFPCFDQPDLKATFDLTIVAPVEWEVISSEPSENTSYQGVLPSSISQHQTSLLQEHTFHPSSLISTYLFSICAGPFTVIPMPASSLPIRVLYRKSMSTTIMDLFFQWIRAGLDYYEDFFQVKYPFSKLDFVFIAEGRFMAMENVGCITLSETYLFLSEGMQVELARACNTFLHEIAHMWFGNLVTMQWWDDLWLNESFATYISYCCQDHALHKEWPFIWRLFLSSKDWGYESDAKTTTHPISVHVPDSGTVDSHFDGISYAKGSAVLKQLHFLVGKSVWKSALRDYISRFAYKNTNFSDLITTISLHSSHLPLNISTWAEMWIKTCGLNTIQANWTAENGKIAQFFLIQSVILPQFPTLRLHKMQIDLYDSEMTLIIRHFVTVLPEKCTNLPELIGKNAPFCVILNTGDFAFIKVLIDSQSLRFCLSNFTKIDNFLTRQIVIKSIWERVSDNFMSGAEFIDRFLGYFMCENDYFMSENVLIFLEKAVKENLPPGMIRNYYSSRLFQCCLSRLKGKIDRINRKIILGKMFRFLCHPRDIQEAMTWLESGMPTSPPIHLNQVGRWVILSAYAGISPVSNRLIEREYQIDRSIQGRYYYLICNSAYPDSGNKDKIWTEIVKNTSKYTTTELYFLCQGFNNPCQKWLFCPYYSKYLCDLGELSRGDLESRAMKTVCLGLIPHYAGPEQCLELLDRFAQELNGSRPELHRAVQGAMEDLTRDVTAYRLSLDYFTSRSHSN